MKGNYRVVEKKPCAYFIEIFYRGSEQEKTRVVVIDDMNTEEIDSLVEFLSCLGFEEEV